MRTSEPYLIDQLAPQVTRAFVESRLAGVPRYLQTAAASTSTSGAASRKNSKGKQSDHHADGDTDSPFDEDDSQVILIGQLDQVCPFSLLFTFFPRNKTV